MKPTVRNWLHSTEPLPLSSAFTDHTERGKTQRTIRKLEMLASRGTELEQIKTTAKKPGPIPISFPLYGLHHLSSFAQFYYSCSSGQNF
jgi:hypothetical protein